MTEPSQPTDAAGKDSPAGAESTLSSDVLAFLAAVRDALTVPSPALGAPGGYDEMRRITTSRAAAVRLATTVAVKMGTPHWGVLTDGIRDSIARTTVTYPVRQDDEPAGGAR